MPANSFIYRNSSLNRFKLTILFLIFPLFFFGQTLTGLWTGALSNDSTTVRKDQLFEIALTEYKGKVYGYSRSEFIVNDTLYYIVKRVKGTIEGDVCEVTDDDIIAYNFRGKLDKGIKVTSTFRRNSSDSSWYLAGNWKTNATKKYYSVTGKVDLEQEKDLAASKIFPHLEELKLTKDIAFYNERNKGAPIVKIARPEKIKTEYTFSNEPLTATANLAITPKQPEVQRSEPEIVLPEIKKPEGSLPKTETKNVAAVDLAITPKQPEVQRSEPEIVLPEIKKPEGSLPKTETKDVAAGQVTVTPSSNIKTVAVNKPPVVIQQQKTPASTNADGERSPAVTMTAAKNTEQPTNAVAKNNTIPVQTKNVAPNNTTKPAGGTAANNTVAVKTNNISINTETKKPETNSVAQKTNTATNTVSAPVVKAAVPEPKKSVEELTQKVATIAGRKSEFSQVVNFKSDSLVLSLYDNGEIDGDTVSVIMNGETIMAKQGLKASAIRKTIHIKPGQEEDFTLVLFADNLGKYPPNTGLLVVHDGEDIYHLRFSSDFQKSSGIVFRRKN